jgi:CubicO group peptidase (beta-lactamase class C family)
MKKRIIFTLLIVVMALLAATLSYLNYLAPGITGYASKNLASGVFVSGRSQESIEKEDINLFPVNLSNNLVDYNNKEVTSRFLLWKAKAIYNEGLGCTLVRDFPEEVVKSMFYPYMPLSVVDPDTIPWPEGDMLSDTVPSGINVEKLNGVLDRIFEDTLTFKGTFAVIIVYKDLIVAERYRSDFNPSIRFLSWSMAKSFTNAMVGLMVKEGKVDINAPVGREEWVDDDRKNITLDNLLQMNSGLSFNEKYSTLKLTDATIMLLKNGDMGDYAASKRLNAKPDSIWSYSSGGTNIIQDYLRSVFDNDEEYLLFPRKSLFNKTGMSSVVWEPDASGTLVGSSYLYATARDYARFGLLYLHNGNWMGEQLFPDDWVNYTTSPAEGSNGEYGALFWLNRSGVFPEIPADLYYCDGYNGQRIFIIPSEQMVIVRTGCSPRGTFDWQAFLKGIVGAVE